MGDVTPTQPEGGSPADAGLWARAAELAAGSRPFVMATVVRAQGSTPRNPGARLIWLPDEGFIGTVGGGHFERLVLADARRCYQQRAAALERYTLATDADQCCGGVMDVFLEYIGPRRRVVLFGSGHVSLHVARLLRDATVEVVVVDDRPDWNTPERFPDCRRLLSWDEGIRAASESPRATLACVMTCSHDTDYDIVRRLLDAPPAFLGLIGSRSKRACFFSRLAGAGVGEAALEGVKCPVGLGDMGKAPSLVAVSIAGKLLLEAARLEQL